MLDISHTPSPQELLPQRLLSGIQQEKAQSQRLVNVIYHVNYQRIRLRMVLRSVRNS